VLEDLERYESSVYSQSGEDGVLRRIFDCIGERSRFYVEFGAADGYYVSNTAHLRVDRGWTGLLLDGGDRPPTDARVEQAFVTAENVEALFEKFGVPTEFDLLSIDIDGNDYWVWEAIERFTPRVVVIEYNIFFPLDVAVTVPYDAHREWDETTYHGASLGALRKLGARKGYSLVYTDTWAPNAFFVRSEELPAAERDLPIERVAHWAMFSEPPDEARERHWEAV